MRQYASSATLRRPIFDTAGFRRVFWPAAAISWTAVWWLYVTLQGQHGDLTWWTTDASQPYGRGVAEAGAYLYSPAVLQLLSPLRVLPWEAVVWIWAALMLGSLAYCAGRLTPLIILAPPVMGELAMSNMHLLYAAAIVIGFRWPGAWSLLLLTKVTPGIGLLWFAVRREWRHLFIALGVTGAVVAVSVAIGPHLWISWFELLRDASQAPPVPFQPNAPFPIPLLFRLPLAAALVIWGARTDRKWTVPVAVVLALPVIWTASLAILVAVIPFILPSQSLAGFRPRRSAPDVPGA